MSTLPAPRPELQAPPTNPAFGGTGSGFNTIDRPLAGAYFDPELMAAVDATKDMDPMLRWGVMNNIMNDRRQEKELQMYPKIIKMASDAQYENAQRAQQLGMQSNIFGGLLKTFDLPGKVIAARHMYGPEEATNYTRGLQSFGSVNVPRYF